MTPQNGGRKKKLDAANEVILGLRRSRRRRNRREEAARHITPMSHKSSSNDEEADEPDAEAKDKKPKPSDNTTPHICPNCGQSSINACPKRKPAGADEPPTFIQGDTTYKYRSYRSHSANQLTHKDQKLEPTVVNLDVIILEAGRVQLPDEDDEDDVDGDVEEIGEDEELDEEADPADTVDLDAESDAEPNCDEEATAATTPFTYADESPSDYRPGGYHPVNVGDCFKQRYFAISKLGWGHYSTVWLCFDTERQGYCAIKLVKSAELYAESARHEVRLLKHIQQLSWHPLRERVVHLTDNFKTSGVNGTHQCLVFDVLGDNMLMLIQRSSYQGLPLYNVKQIAFQVLQGLYLLHDQANLIHTDLKPENVLLVADDVALRTQATETSKKYLEEHVQQQLVLANLSKTAKRRQRTKTKQSISFFQAHRKWLRNRGVADLLQLARHGLLTKKMATDAVTNRLPFVAFDGPNILSPQDLERLACSEQVAEQVGDTASGAVGELQPQPARVMLGKKRPRECRTDTACSKAFRLLQSSTEKFMRHVQKCVEKDEEDDFEPSHFNSKRMKAKKPAKKSGTQRGASRAEWQTETESSGRSPAAASSKVNLNLIKRKDPALEPCKLKIAIADVGNACFIDHHVTEDIQTREYRAVEVILGAGYDTSADLWSAACLFWELATGEYLFEPNKWRGDASQDEVHMAHIIETCGPIPKELIARGEYSREIFDATGQLLHIKHLEAHPLNKVLMERYNWSASDANEFTDFLMPMLCTNPRRRVTAFAAINHPWLLLDNDEEENADENEVEVVVDDDLESSDDDDQAAKKKKIQTK